MNLNKAVVLFGFAIVMTATTGRLVFGEEAAVAPVDPAVITSNQQTAALKESDIQWAWGEITNLDNQAKTVTLKYLDYETDQEKELILVVDEKTTFENIKNFNELKLKDTLSIDYIIGADNKNIAKNISFEKPDVSSSVPAVTENSEPITPPSMAGQSVVDVAGPAVPVATTKSLSEVLSAVTPYEAAKLASEAMQPTAAQPETPAAPEAVQPTAAQPETPAAPEAVQPTAAQPEPKSNNY